eukprot:scaffold35905_cov50-Cyclotella_meneghiniana.AAC.2
MFPYNNAADIFSDSGCDHTGQPSSAGKSPFCKSLCFTDINIGSGSDGSSAVTDGKIEITGSGNGETWGSSDSFHYYYNEEVVSGNIEIEMYVDSFETTLGDLPSNAEGGIMIRDHLAADSKHFSLYVRGNRLLRGEYRTADGGDTSVTTAVENTGNEVWLKITKSGTNFRAYYRTDNEWVEVDNENFEMNIDNFYYGIATSAADSNKMTKLTVSDFTFENIDDSSKRVQETKHLPSREPEVKVNDNASTTAAKTPDLKNRENARALTKDAFKFNSYFLDMEVYDGSHSQLFNIQRVEDSNGNIVVGVFKIYSVQYPDMLLSLSDDSCHDNTDIVLWEDQDDDYSTWKITGGTIEN